MRFLFKVLLILAGAVAIASCGGGDDDDIIGGFDDSGNSSVVSSSLTGTVDGHSYVDLGLSVKWATCNVGTTVPDGYGYYYAWGETSTRTSYFRDNYKFYDSSIDNFKNIGNNISGTSYDAAKKKWGSKWRMPTSKEMEELVTNCSWTWTTSAGVKGYKVVGKNGQSIFLPANGCYTGYEKGAKAGIFGQYWTGTYKGSSTMYRSSYSLTFTSSRKVVDWSTCDDGLAIRPVTTASADTQVSDNDDNTDSGSIGGSTTTSYEKPSVGFYNFTAGYTTLKVQYKIYNKDKAKVTSAKIYYGTSSNPTKSKTATVSGVMITGNISGLKRGTTYYVKCKVTGKGGTTTTSATKCITNY